MDTSVRGGKREGMPARANLPIEKVRWGEGAIFPGGNHFDMSTLQLTLAVNSVAMGGLLFLLSAGFSLIFGLMRIPNLMHGSFFMLGAYLGFSMIERGMWFWAAVVLGGVAMAILGGLIERYRTSAPAAQFRILVSPLVTFLWLGSLLALFGGLLAAWPEPGALRGRVRARYAARVAQELRA